MAGRGQYPHRGVGSVVHRGGVHHLWGGNNQGRVNNQRRVTRQSAACDPPRSASPAAAGRPSRHASARRGRDERDAAAVVFISFMDIPARLPAAEEPALRGRVGRLSVLPKCSWNKL